MDNPETLTALGTIHMHVHNKDKLICKYIYRTIMIGPKRYVTKILNHTLADFVTKALNIYNYHAF
jgi:hypothetical protein